MCLTVKDLLNRGTKRKSMENILCDSSSKLNNGDCILKVIWDEVDNNSMGDSIDENASDSDDSLSINTNNDS